jgi:multicomponent Na+:H+ antiporter subunit G
LLVCLLSCLGLVVMKGFYNKLHYLAPPAILATTAIAAAILVQEGWSSCAIKAGLVLLVMAITNPILTFAASRANYLRETQAGRERKDAPSTAPTAPSAPPRTPGEDHKL